MAIRRTSAQFGEADGSSSRLSPGAKYYWKDEISLPLSTVFSPVRLWGFCTLQPIPTQLREVLQVLK
jgi:hypothetical protein